MNSARNDFVDYAVELMAGWSAVSVRKMFGGYGLYREGLMFALIVDDELFFKTDEDNMAQFERAGSHPFVYVRQSRNVRLSYWSAPAGGLEYPSEMSEWCQSAYGAALRAQAGSKARKGKRK